MTTNMVFPASGYDHYWRLCYADGRLYDEPLNGGSVKDSPSNATELYVMKRGQTRPLWRIPIPSGGRPVWYRKRSLDVTVSGRPKGPVKLDATVFGFVYDAGNSLDGKLWMLYGDQAVNVPNSYLDQVAIESCYNRE
jgi:hypothetical protein